MTRQIKLAALLTVMTLALGGLARAQWDDDDDYYQHGNGAQARQSGYQNGYRDGVSKAGMKGKRTIPRTSAFPTRAKPAAATGTGWVRSGCIRTPTATGIAPDSGQATTMRAAPGATATAIPMTSQPSTAAAVMADPGRAIAPTKLAFRMVHRWGAGT